MEQQVIIRCKNNKKTLKVAIGSTLSDIFSQSGLKMDYGPINAKVNNKVEGLHYRVYNQRTLNSSTCTMLPLSVPIRGRSSSC